MADKEQLEKEPSIEEILESIRQIISDDGSGSSSNDPLTEDKSEGKLDLSAKADQSSIDDMFNEVKPDSLDLSRHEDAFKDNSDLNLSKKDDPFKDNSNLDLSRREDAFKDNSNLDLSKNENAFKDNSNLDLSQHEDPFKDNANLDLSQSEDPFKDNSNLDLSKSADDFKDNSNLDLSQKEDILDLTNDMKVGVADMSAAGYKMENNESLLSEQTASVASAQLAKLLATNIAVEKEDISRVGKVTLEDMVLELMKPLVKDWLDRNLPAVIERVVKREIEKISQRAQDR